MNSGDYSPTPILNLQQSETTISSISESEASISSISHSYTSSESESSMSSSSFDIKDLLFKTAKLDEDLILRKNGYQKISHECDTLQGELLKAKVIINKSNIAIGSEVAIKKIDKILYNDKIAIQDDMNYCVSEDVVKEALILKHITVDNNTTMSRDYIVKFVDFFKCSQYYYLCTQYIPHSINLKQWITNAHQLINNGQLSFKEYQKAVKYIIWQLNTAITWLHNVYHCCHLDICLQNVLVENHNFIQNKDGKFITNKSVSIKILDFGVADLFNKSFKCHKQGLNIENECYVAPNVYKGRSYDARKADMFTLGLILYECMVGRPLYKACDMWESPQNGYYALMKGDLLPYLQMYGLQNRFQKHSFSLLQNLLNIDENKRFNAMQVMKHIWFKKYYKKYQKIISKEIKMDEKLLQNKNKYFPVYSKKQL